MVERMGSCPVVLLAQDETEYDESISLVECAEQREGHRSRLMRLLTSAHSTCRNCTFTYWFSAESWDGFVPVCRAEHRSFCRE